MPGQSNWFSVTSIVDVPESAANTETVVATLPGITVPYSGLTVHLKGMVVYTPGATATSVTVRIRRNSLVGALVGEANPESGDIVAAKATTLQVFGDDSPGEPAGMAYVLTVQGAGEGGAGNAAAMSLEARIG